MLNPKVQKQLFFRRWFGNFWAENDAKYFARGEQQQQIPFGDDNQKGNGHGNRYGHGSGNDNRSAAATATPLQPLRSWQRQ
jgi:hypothetical protein